MLRIDRPTTDHCSWKSLLGRTSNGHISVTVPDGRIRWSVTRQMATSVIDRYWILKSGNFYELRETISNNNLDASHYWYHRLNGSSSPVLTATSLSYGKAKNSTLHRIKNPDPIEIKFGTIDYVGEMTPHAKFHVNPSKGGFPANGWNIRKNFYSYPYTFF